MYVCVFVCVCVCACVCACVCVCVCVCVYIYLKAVSNPDDNLHKTLWIYNVRGDILDICLCFKTLQVNHFERISHITMQSYNKMTSKDYNRVR